MIGRAFEEGQEHIGNADRDLYGKSMVEQKKKQQDPWAGRSSGMRCMTCIWFVPKELASLGTGKVGRCRRHAPTMNGYPVVYLNDWCGDHRVDENKV